MPQHLDTRRQRRLRLLRGRDAARARGAVLLGVLRAGVVARNAGKESRRARPTQHAGAAGARVPAAGAALGAAQRQRRRRAPGPPQPQTRSRWQPTPPTPAPAAHQRARPRQASRRPGRRQLHQPRPPPCARRGCRWAGRRPLGPPARGMRRRTAPAPHAQPGTPGSTACRPVRSDEPVAAAQLRRRQARRLEDRSFQALFTAASPARRPRRRLQPRRAAAHWPPTSAAGSAALMRQPPRRPPGARLRCHGRPRPRRGCRRWCSRSAACRQSCGAHRRCRGGAHPAAQTRPGARPPARAAVRSRVGPCTSGHRRLRVFQWADVEHGRRQHGSRLRGPYT